MKMDKQLFTEASNLKKIPKMINSD